MEEIEIRGKISKKDFERLNKLLSEQGKLIKHYHRLSIDLSPGFDPRTRTWPKDDLVDLRIKKTDRQEKITVKVGDFNAQKREELEINLAEGQLVEALKMFAALGFSQGMVYFGQNWEYEYRGFEVKLVQYANDYFNWEIESHQPDLDPNALAEKLNLHPFLKEEYKKEINWQNQNLHQLYSLKIVEKILQENF